MRTYYASDKKRREDAKRKQREEKRLKRLTKNTATNSASTEPEPVPPSDTKVLEPGNPDFNR
jgi:hypothetical protein